MLWEAPLLRSLNMAEFDSPSIILVRSATSQIVLQVDSPIELERPIEAVMHSSRMMPSDYVLASIPPSKST